MNAPAFTLSRELVASLRPTLPTERLPVPELVERLKASEAEQKRLEAIQTRIDTAEWYRNGDLLAAEDDRQFIYRTALIAEFDAALAPTGLTFSEAVGLGIL